MTIPNQPFKAILSTSRRFRALGLEEALRSLVWDTADKTHRRLAELLQSPEKRRIPRMITMRLGGSKSDGETHFQFDWDSTNLSLARKPDLHEAMRIRGIGMLANLRTLAISGGTILPYYFDAFRQLRHLNRLRLESCTICAPHSGAAADPFGEPDLAVTALELHDVILCNQIHRMTPHLWQRVQEFTVSSSTHATAYVEIQAAAFLSHLPNLLSLHVYGVQMDSDVLAWTTLEPPSIAYMVPLLRSFSGSWRMAMEIVACGIELAEIRLPEEISVNQACELVEGLNPKNTRVIELVIEACDEGFFRLLPQALPRCEVISIVYRSGNLTSDTLLRTIPNQLLRHLPKLTIFRLRPASDATLLHSIFRRHFQSYSEYMATLRVFHRDLALGRVRQPPPTESDCFDYVVKWGRANKRLERISLVPRKEWVRRGTGDQWTLRIE
uniref:F-box domain-containing protein n=1 Tax=Mycena chlorophos TaxID=658473 RepID=A0ABQ0LUN1_MYCCL|nr:predicted protein [Mycena chlorophos]